MKPLRFLLPVAAVISFSFSVSAAPSSPIYQKALKFYNAGNYDSTITVIKAYLKTNGKSPEAEDYVPLIIEAMVRKEDYSGSRKLFDLFRQKFPQSTYAARVLYLEGTVQSKEYRYPAAIKKFSDALKSNGAKPIDSLIFADAENICKNGLTADELGSLCGQNDLNSRLAEVVGYYRIVKLVSSGQLNKAKTAADDFKKLYAKSRFEQPIKDLINKGKDDQKGDIQIGMLAPLSGDDADVGRKVIQGAQIAIDEYNSTHGSKVKPVILDTKGSAVETAYKTKELIEQYSVPAFIGPVLSSEAAVSAAMVTGKDIVMLTPTATDDGIAGLGNNIFQMNNSLGVLGHRIAKYAVENLNIHDFAIIAPRSAYGQVLTASFKDELKSHSDVQVVAEISFDEDKNDYSSQFQQLRSALLQKKLGRRVTRSDSAKYADTSLQVGGIFIPAEAAEDVVMLVPQVMFNRIKTQILGSNGWHSPKVILDGKHYVTNAFISSSYEPENDRKEWTDFKRNYKLRYNSEADRVTALGYDAATLMIKALNESGWSKDANRISRAFQNVQAYRGLSGMISFNKGGANTESPVLKINDTGFLRVQ